MAFSRGSVNPDAAGGSNAHARAAFRKIQQDIEELKKRSGAEAVDFDKQTPIGGTPGQGKIEVRPLSGRFTVIVTNPQYVVGVAGSQKTRNPLRAQVLHRISFSLNALFDGTGDVRTYGPSTQTHWSIDDVGVSLRYVRLESSLDGENWNKPVISGPFQS